MNLIHFSKWRLFKPSALAFLLFVLANLSACTNPHHVFSGKWEVTSGPDELPKPFGHMQLLLGHYSSEIAGIARFYNSFGLPLKACPCAIIRQQYVHVGAQSTRFSLELCDESTWIFELRISQETEPLEMEGRLILTEDEGQEDSLTLHFQLLDSFIAHEERQCEP